MCMVTTALYSTLYIHFCQLMLLYYYNSGHMPTVYSVADPGDFTFNCQRMLLYYYNSGHMPLYSVADPGESHGQAPPHIGIKSK